MTDIDGAKCNRCGHSAFHDENGVCAECEKISQLDDAWKYMGCSFFAQHGRGRTEENDF